MNILPIEQGGSEYISVHDGETKYQLFAMTKMEIERSGTTYT